MRTLPANLRRELETAVLSARRAAESVSRAALDTLGVFSERRPEYLDAGRARLRNGLRAKWRQLGSDRELLVAECAYEQWHRLLFARFLAENNLLLHPQYETPVTLADCEDLAAELSEPDGWSVAARFAAEILPGIFRLDDPCVLLRLAPEGRYELEQILTGLSAEIFTADDALGWVYQLWQKDKKDEVNESGRKISGPDLAPVTQLFTENYMVRFLLENSLGAWWVAHHPESPLANGFEYIRVNNDGAPGAGAFDSWPHRIAEVAVMDPCCGSGHFLVEAFSMLWQMRAEDENLSVVAAQDAVLRDNLFGLEIDQRCVQIAMFAVALQAWKTGGGWRELPIPNIGCSGISVKAPVEEWKKLARGDDRLENALGRLHTLFENADTLGSLIDPKRTAEAADPRWSQRSFDDVDWNEISPLLEEALSKEDGDPATVVLGSDLAGIARAASYLSRKYSLVATNVPYLGIGRMASTLAEYARTRYSNAKHDLATVFLDRALGLVSGTGSIAIVAPQSWLYMPRYENYRRQRLTSTSFDLVGRLGSQAFEGISGEVVSVNLFIMSAIHPSRTKAVASVDASMATGQAKGVMLQNSALEYSSQTEQLNNPDARITFAARGSLDLLRDYADSRYGLRTGDSNRFIHRFWEMPCLSPAWVPHLSTVSSTKPYGGRENYLLWEDGAGALAKFAQFGIASLQGGDAWGRRGIVVSLMGDLPCYLYTGEKFDNNCAVLWPRHDSDLPALWAYVSSPVFHEDVRLIDNSLKVMNATLLKVPFDAERWRKVAADAGSLPEPWSDCPTQWLFEGRPEVSTSALQVAVGRLVGFCWPGQSQNDDLAALADIDGIVCLPTVAGESPAADRLQQVLAIAFGANWSPAKTKELLAQAGSKKKNVVEWLRDEFFKQHCALFENRPFIWHIWDGQRDGFSALVNYHRLDRKLLEKLTYTYLGQDWVERQRAAARDEVPGAEGRLSAALALQRKLEAILEGEKPYDIYVRWKEMPEQSIGWEPDLNDGVRLNIRPFVEAGVLRSPFNVHWRKDRGKNPDGTERLNEINLSLAQKRAARHQVGLT